MEMKQDLLSGLNLAELVYFIMVNEKTIESLWSKLCATCEKETASNKVYLMKKLFELQMKECGSIASHLNELNIIFNQLQAQKLNFDVEMKAITPPFRPLIDFALCVLLFASFQLPTTPTQLNRYSNSYMIVSIHSHA